ncbi:MAG: hypothetical protein KOO63_01410 [Bacteroidales bacterium]|nr:hypothetical protein [Candidatus Latescibacterota bacterium]
MNGKKDGSGGGRRDGSGPGRGMNQGTGNGKGLGKGGGRGRNQGGGFGPGGFCVCASCGHKVAHAQGTKCTSLKCPECGKPMVREELLEKND